MSERDPGWEEEWVGERVGGKDSESEGDWVGRGRVSGKVS